MGTEVAISFTSLRTQLENAKSSLSKIDDNIKKIVQTSGRYQADRYQNQTGDLNRSGPRVGRNIGPEGVNNFKQDDERFKRKHETKTVFSRLSVRQPGDSDQEDGAFPKRPRISSQVIRELPTKQDILKAQEGDEVSKLRNRRMFGSLLGTLQKFKQDSIVLKTKEDKKAQIERKIEEQAIQERENQKKERQNLFAEREVKKATIKALESKMARMREFEKWELGQKLLSNYILTKSKPPIHWLPKKMNEKTKEKLASSKRQHEKLLEKKREELQEELDRIEQKCLRNAKIPQNAAAKRLGALNMDSKENKGREEDSDSDNDSSDQQKFVSDIVKIEKVDPPIKVEKDTDQKIDQTKTDEQSSKTDKDSPDIQNEDSSKSSKTMDNRTEESQTVVLHDDNTNENNEKDTEVREENGETSATE